MSLTTYRDKTVTDDMFRRGRVERSGTAGSISVLSHNRGVPFIQKLHIVIGQRIREFEIQSELGTGASATDSDTINGSIGC